MKKILIVEDDQYLRGFYAKLFQSRGFGVDLAENGLNGLKLIEKKYYDLISTDLAMPVMDGIQLLKSIKENKLKYGKILVLANIDSDPIIRQCFELGADEYLIHSANTPEQILKLVEEMLGNKIIKEQAQEQILKISTKNSSEGQNNS